MASNCDYLYLTSLCLYLPIALLILWILTCIFIVGYISFDVRLRNILASLMLLVILILVYHIFELVYWFTWPS